jgi:hypothetical protein
MIDQLAYVYTPTKTADGEGGWTFSVSDPARVFVAIDWHHSQATAYVRQGCHAVNSGDILEINGEYYRALVKIQTNLTGYYSFTVEKVSRPEGL